MPTIEVDCGNGIGLNKENELIIKVDEEQKEELRVSENGVWAKGIKRLDDQCTDDWSVLVKPTDADHQNDPKNIMGNGRVVNKIRIFSFMKHARASTGTDDSNKVWYLKSKDPNSASASDLKYANDLVRELNFSTWYSDGTNHGPLCLPRPGTLIGFSDAIYGTTKYSNRIYEDGKRFPTFTYYKWNGATATQETVPQHLYALFIITHIEYSNYSASHNFKAFGMKSDFPSANPTDYKICRRIKLKCVWSDTTAFSGLLNTTGWKAGEYLPAAYNSSTPYGEWSSEDVYGPDPSNI